MVKKTEQAVSEFWQKLFHGSIQTLTWVNPLQSRSTHIVSEPLTKNGETIFALRDFSSRSTSGKHMVVFRPDTPHPGFDSTHINTVEGKSIRTGQYVPSSEFQRTNINKMNHIEIPESVYRILKDFDGTAKKIRIGARVLLVAGIVWDTFQLCRTVEADLHDADRKIGKKTYSETASIVGSWSFGALGAQLGAHVGAGIGTAILPGVGTAIGGAFGGLTLGIVGSFSGSDFGWFVIDITVTE